MLVAMMTIMESRGSLTLNAVELTEHPGSYPYSRVNCALDGMSEESRRAPLIRKHVIHLWRHYSLFAARIQRVCG